ncbi:type III secretion system chaperone [Thalassoglobus sp. JC818]|uniref:type III secretion system chaperone n=1 Tax=Thalassoglobus sp. JC818 TaxID=3232136 RepID=UPI003457B902
MNRRENITCRLREVGQFLEYVTFVIQRSESEWVIAFDDYDKIFVHFEEQLGMLTFLSVIGELPEDTSPKLLKLALTLNGAWSETGGVQMAFDDQNRLIQILRVPEHVDEQTCLQIVEDQRDKSKVWKELIDTHFNDVALGDGEKQTKDAFIQV